MTDEQIMEMLREIDPLAVRLPPYTRELAVSAYQAGRRAGAEAMRERAAKETDPPATLMDAAGNKSIAYRVREDRASAIRALPLDPEGGK